MNFGGEVLLDSRTVNESKSFVFNIEQTSFPRTTPVPNDLSSKFLSFKNNAEDYLKKMFYKVQYADVTLTNRMNKAYSTTIYAGYNMQPFSVILDTNKDRTFLFDSTCANCQMRKFYRQQSSTFKYYGTTDSASYTDGSSLNGIKAFDWISLDSQATCAASSFNFFLTTSEVGFDNSEGWLGLGRYNSGSSYKNILETLYDQSKISYKGFAIYMADQAYYSTLQVGAYDSYYMRSGIT